MWKNYIFLSLTFFGLTGRLCAQIYTPIATSGYNRDAIAEATSASVTTSGAIDGSDHVMYTINYGQTFFPFAAGIPNNGLISTSTRTYQLQSYTQNNALYVPSLQTDSLLFVTPAPCTIISLLAFATESLGIINVTIRFTDNTTQVFNNISMPDWYTVVNSAVLSNFDRANRTNGLPDVGSPNNMYPVDLVLSCANSTKSIQSVAIQNTTAIHRMVILAISGASWQYTVSPPPSSAICQGGSFVASVTSSSPQSLTYSWTGPPGMSFSSGNGASTTVFTNPISTPTALLVYTVAVSPANSNCPVINTLSVNIVNPSVPILTMPPTLCNTSAITSASANSAGGVWFGNPIISPNGLISPSQATSFGQIPVCYSISVSGCTVTNCANILISQFITASLTGSIPNKCSHDSPVDLMSIVSNTTGTWAGVGASPTTFSPGLLPTGTYTLNYFTTSTPFPGVCNASSSIAVSVFNPPVPSINVIAPKCTNSPSILLSASPSGGLWSGNLGVTATGLLNPALCSNTMGINSVSYTAGQGTCVAVSSTSFQVNRFNSAALSANFLQLCVNSNTVNLMSLVNNTVNGTWTGGLGLTGTYSFNPAGLQTNTYTLNYHTSSSPNPLCRDSSSLNISVFNPVQPVIGQSNTKCNTDMPFQLSANPAIGAFIPSTYLSGGGVFTPSLSSIGNNVVQYVIGTNTCNAVATKLIKVEAFVPATITGTIADQCNTNATLINLLPLTLSSIGSWSGPGVFGSGFNPSVSGVGSMLLTYQTSSQPGGLCPDSKTLAVHVYSLAIPAINPVGPYCNSFPPVRLSVSPLGGFFGGIAAVSPQGLFNPASASIGGNVVNYSVTAGPCVAFAQSTIQIEKFISADFAAYAGPFCKNDAAIDLNSLAQNPGGIWGGPGVTGALFTPANANAGGVNIITYDTHSFPDADLCPDSRTISIQVNAVPNVSVTAVSDQSCSPVEVTFKSSDENAGRGQWTFGDGSPAQAGLSAFHTYTAAGSYSVVFNYWDALGCSTQAKLNNALTVYEVPHPAFSYSPYDEVNIAQPDVQFLNQTPDLGNSTYSWQMANLDTTTDVSPKVSFTRAGEYLITLTATTIHGCKSEVKKMLIVKPGFSIYIPNSFTPNSDGLNDTFQPVFSPYGVDTHVFEMEIFDRWGASLYDSKDITKGWDGSVQNKSSEFLKEDVYVYQIKYKDLAGKIYHTLGSVTLLK